MEWISERLEPPPDFREDERRFRIMDGAGSQWWWFIEYITFKNRYRHEEERAVEEVLLACGAVRALIKEGSELYRSRTKPPTRDREPFPCDEMGTLPPELAPGGRMNPPGIPYLYLASTPQTAIAEVRPWKGASISVATYRAQRPIRLLDLVSDLEGDLRETWVRRNVGTLFSRPTHPDDAGKYAPSQFISEHLKDACRDCDGILYPSAMQQGGLNIALFGPRPQRGTFDEMAKCVGADLWEVEEVEVVSSKA